MVKQTLTLDIETTGLDPLKDFVTCICAKTADGDIFHEAGSDDPAMIKSFFRWLEKYPREQHLLLTKNGKSFDFPFLVCRIVLQGLDQTFVQRLNAYDHIDLQDITPKWTSLDSMAEILCLGKKIGWGRQAITLYNEGDLAGLIKYCMRDVILTETIYEIRQRLRIEHAGIVEKKEALLGDLAFSATPI